MAIISSYPTIQPTSSDLVLVVDTSEDGNPTKTATVGSVNALATAPSIVVKTFTITGTALDNLGSTPVVLQALAGDATSGEYVQLIGQGYSHQFSVQEVQSVEILFGMRRALLLHGDPPLILRTIE